MKDSKQKEHRISNLKDMISNVKEENDPLEFEDIEEDSELIDYLNEDNTNYEELGINDEFIYHPGDEDTDAINLEENPIDEEYIIKTPKTEDIEDDEEYDEFEDDIVGEISENFDNVINAKIKGRPILAIVSTVLGVILIVISIFIFESRSDRVIDNVVAGESSFMFVIFLIVGLFLLCYGIYKLFNIKNPFSNITSSIDSIQNDKKDDKKDEKDTGKEKPSPKAIPKSKIPLDKDSYKIGEFDMEDLKTSVKKPTNSNKNSDVENIEDIPPAKKTEKAEEIIEEESTEIKYEQSELENESIDDIFAEVEDIEDMPIISIDSEEEKE
jgi:hypothetical protein